MDTVRVMVQLRGIDRNVQRYRAGLGPFSVEPKEVEVSQDQLEALKADPMLEVVVAHSRASRASKASRGAK